MSSQECSASGLPPAFRLQEHLAQTLIDSTFGAVLLLQVDGLVAPGHPPASARRDRRSDLVDDYLRQCGRTGSLLPEGGFGLVLRRGQPTFDDREFSAGLSRLAVARGQGPVTVSGGGVHHPGEDFHLDPRAGDVLLATARRLLARASEQGDGCVLWLPAAGPVVPALQDLALGLYQELARASSAVVRQLQVESRIDYLTGLANRRGFEDVARRLTEAAQRSGTSLGLVYLDSDSLKGINDTLGHDAGDRFVVAIARVLQQVVRGSDFISRWGADEFAVLMDAVTPEQALSLARRILQAVSTRTAGTVSIGVYCGVPASVEAAVQRADQALYRAKAQGKNRVEAATD